MGLLDRFDSRNQQTLGQHNRQEKELVSKGAERILAWSFLLPLVVGLVVFIVLAFTR